MRYLSLGEIVALHQALLEQSGGATGIRDMGMLESAWRSLAPHLAVMTCMPR
jgi:prophage maintenance system killer protein